MYIVFVCNSVIYVPTGSRMQRDVNTQSTCLTTCVHVFACEVEQS